jgi:hypothetical protein
VLNSLNSADAKRGYRHVIDEFVDWYCSEPCLAFNRIVVLRYRSHLESRQLAPGTINLRLGAVLSFAKTPRQPNFIHVTCYTASLYVVEFKCAPNFDETHARRGGGVLGHGGG